MVETHSDVFARDGRRRATQRGTVLYVAFHIDELGAASSRHHLDGLEIVCFGRGDRAASRTDIDGRPGLAIQVPDPVMSSAHGRLVRVDGGWQFEDPGSKNGAVIDGRRTRLSRIAPGAVFQLGHTLFLVEHATFMDGTAADVTGDSLPPPLSELTTVHPQLAASVADLERVATADVPILLLGETGTGKEVFARAVHALSGRRGALVAVNCGAIPSSLIESELFGHKKGAFSGALADRLGHLRAAHGGTLFLDEIGELSLAAQTALLRALQQHEVVPVGESAPVPVDLRLVAATHRDLPALIREERFRDDLYSRLLGVTITLPPLRERRCDLGIVVASLLRRLDPASRARLTPAAARALFAYAWPRNIRELERALAGGLARSSDGMIDVEHLPDDVAACIEREAAPAGATTPAPSVDPDDEALRAAIVDALVRNDGNVTAAARELGKHREQVHRWARRLGIDLNSFRH